MPPLDAHIKKSIERTGKEYREVHEWIDHPEKKYERHNIRKALEFAKMFEEKYGHEAAIEYIEHISDDVFARFSHNMDDHNKAISDTLSYFGAK